MGVPINRPFLIIFMGFSIMNHSAMGVMYGKSRSDAAMAQTVERLPKQQGSSAAPNKTIRDSGIITSPIWNII